MKVLAEQMAGIMPNLELLVIPGCDHHTTMMSRKAVPALMAFLDRHTISWVNYSLCDKDETSAALKSAVAARKEGLEALLDRDSLLVPETLGPDGYPVWTQTELSPSGAFVRTRMRERTTAQPIEGER